MKGAALQHDQILKTIIATTSVGIFRMNPENRKTTASDENSANEQSPVRQALRSAEKRQP
jgi:hypothetical protein